MKLYIKNMVCPRCDTAVKSVFEKLKISITTMQLGEVEIATTLDADQLELLSENLNALGFELLIDKNYITIERIKNLIIDLVHYKNDPLKNNLSNYLSEDLRQDYSVLSKLFSEIEETTIEHFFIIQKIERAKELLLYNEMSLSEIAFQLNYSDVAHLSNQFKKNTGFTPTQYLQLKDKMRKDIDNL
ncbi:AraC family transcriptional regulator [Flavobacterium sp. GP15]|uniref:helix-turn-helix domain-containing protein n=1 Tax=Flavobacterium sp. GP15 TaxID=2758567 RepID=UPI00165DCAF8|nr:AraC family transcriptional regulator [Flavobacterium sp. GP15]